VGPAVPCDKGVVTKAQERAFYTTFSHRPFARCGSAFSDSHAKGMACRSIRLLDQGAVLVQTDGTFRLDFAKARKAVAALTREIMTIRRLAINAHARPCSDACRDPTEVSACSIVG